VSEMEVVEQYNRGKTSYNPAKLHEVLYVLHALRAEEVKVSCRKRVLPLVALALLDLRVEQNDSKAFNLQHLTFRR